MLGLAAPLHVHQHAAAHPGPARKLIERPAQPDPSPRTRRPIVRAIATVGSTETSATI